MKPKPRMCNCEQCRGYRTNTRHKVQQDYRNFQRTLFNRKLRRYLKTQSKQWDYELPNYNRFIEYFTD